MATLRASALVQSGSSRQAHHVGTASELLAHLLSPPSTSSASSTQEPPRKRQRLSEIQPLSSDRLGQEDAIVLARIELQLCFESSSRQDTNSPLPFPEPVPVKLTAIEYVQNKDHTLLSISADPKGNAPAQLKILSESLPLIVPHLERVVYLQKAPSLGRQSLDHIAWARCSIVAHEGGALLQAEILWALERSSPPSRQASLLDIYLGPRQVDTAEPWGPKDFYDNVHVPAADFLVSPSIQSDILDSQLYPFQKRAVHWLLQREGASFENGKLVTRPASEKLDHQLPASFRTATDASGHDCFVSNLHGVAIKNHWSLLDYNTNILGGILAEEMGLGKTVELAALVCLHRRPLNATPRKDGLTNSGSTLIITPAHILQQWLNELATHAPQLKVLHYKGLAAAKGNKKVEYTVENLVEYDVVLTTYNVLAREIHFATDPPVRSRRFTQKHKASRSPLVLINWWRVCLDEAQMIETGVSKAAQVAQMIPRINAWAVSGTPVKKQIEDLLGLLVFLRYEPFCSSKKLWQRADKATFKQIFSQIAMRHTKHKVSHELQIPPQKRTVITMAFTAVEEHHYGQLFQQMCDLLGLNPDGTPAGNNYDPNSEKVIDDMRTWLRRLRETCLHPQVGTRNRRALGRGQGPLRTVDEVLEFMIEQNETELRQEERKIVLSQVLRGHIIANDKSNIRRSKEALEIYQDALNEASIYVADCRKELALEEARHAAAVREKREKGQIDIASSDDEADKEGGSNEQTARLAVLKKQLRSALEVQHACVFFVATSHYQIKENENLTSKESDEYVHLEKLETNFYDQAKAIRKEMLQEAHAKASEVMQKLEKQRQSKNGFAVLPEIPMLQSHGGIENRKLLEKMDSVSEVLDEQAKWIEKWRGKVVDILLKQLVDEDQGQDTTGDEYEDSTKLQEELYVYTLALRAMVADRHRCVTGEESYFIEGDTKKPTGGRSVKFAAKGEVRKAIDLAKEGQGHAPELVLEVLGIRNKLKPNNDDPSLRSLIGEARHMHTQLQWPSGHVSADRAATEALIVEKQLNEIQRIQSSETKALAKLEKEQEDFRHCMNLRLEYYRQLQAISDTVAPWKEELDEKLDVNALTDQSTKEIALQKKLSTWRTKRRFLLHLRKESSEQTEGRICVICQDNFESGVLTICGHQYCKECITAWYREHRTCPECRRRLTLADFHDITYKPQQIRAHEELNPTASPTSSSRADSSASSPGSSASITPSTIYSDISSTTMDEIKAIDLNGSYGTKIDTIARHLLYLREHDPGAKSIIFSQYSDFLSTLSSALTHFKIGHVSIRSSGGVEKFRRDPAKEVFLLDAKSDSSGLNLVNATHVFLCEPLINAALELQAIARVHRIGQLRETRVYMYLISDTVEEAIYDISVSRRLAHIGSSHTSSRTTSAAPTRAQTPTPASREKVLERDLDKANNMEIQQAPLLTLLAKGKSGGEIVEREDLWRCLFGKGRVRVGGEGVQNALQMEVDRHLRAEAGEERRAVIEEAAAAEMEVDVEDTHTS